MALKTDDESHKTTRAHKAHGSWHMGLLMRVMHKITSCTTPRKTSTSTQEHGHDAQSMHDDATRSTREGGSEETRARRPDTNAEEVGALACALRVPVRITRPRHASECDKHLRSASPTSKQSRSASLISKRSGSSDLVPLRGAGACAAHWAGATADSTAPRACVRWATACQGPLGLRDSALAPLDYSALRRFTFASAPSASTSTR